MEALMNNENLWHIQEQIFGYLDHETVEICLKVCKSWNATLKKFSYIKFFEEFGDKEIGYTDKIVSTFIPGWQKAVRKYGAHASIDDLQEVKDSLRKLVDKYNFGKCCYYPVHKAAEIGAVKLMKLILNTSYDFDAKNDGGRTPLHFACINDRTEIVELLIKSSSIDLNATNIMGCTAFHLACKYGRAETVELMIKLSKDFSIDLNARVVHSRETGFHLACGYGTPETIDLLIKSSKDFSIDLNIRDYTYLGGIALRRLCDSSSSNQSDKLKTVEELMIKKWNEFGMDFMDYEGETPLAQAKRWLLWRKMLENECSKMDDTEHAA